jgi:hypothetical protein
MSSRSALTLALMERCMPLVALTLIRLFFSASDGVPAEGTVAPFRSEAMGAAEPGLHLELNLDLRDSGCDMSHFFLFLAQPHHG